MAGNPGFMGGGAGLMNQPQNMANPYGMATNLMTG